MQLQVTNIFILRCGATFPSIHLTLTVAAKVCEVHKKYMREHTSALLRDSSPAHLPTTTLCVYPCDGVCVCARARREFEVEKQEGDKTFNTSQV